MPLTVHSDNIDDTAPDGAPEVKSVELSAAVHAKTMSHDKSSAVKLLRTVRDSVNGFGPLKSVAGGLCLVLENCEVCPPSQRFEL